MTLEPGSHSSSENRGDGTGELFVHNRRNLVLLISALRVKKSGLKAVVNDDFTVWQTGSAIPSRFGFLADRDHEADDVV